MADSASKQPESPRIFVKKVGDKTLTREVTSPQSKVSAEFDGYLEQAPAKAPSRPAPASSS